LPPPSRLLLSRPNLEYLRAHLATGDPDRTKRGLQELCRLYRRGYRIGPDQLTGIETSVVGLLHSGQGRDEKVRRWALNAIARLGREEMCLEAVLTIVERYRDDPQTAASAIAAIYKIARDPGEIVRRLTFFDPQMTTLAALQHADPDKIDLSHLPVDIEIAVSDSLMLALVVVGLDRAPPHLFHPRHDNSAIVKVLGGHDDSIVSQYSIWAITENPKLGLHDLGINPKAIEQLPANVRGWVFQLIAMSPADAAANWEYIELGSRDPDDAARLGLAVGLRDTYFDGIEPLVVDWVVNEPNAEIRQAPLDHIVRNCSRCSSYEPFALEFYEKEPVGSGNRLRMAANAVNTPLNPKFRNIDFNGTSDLFSQGVVHVKNETTNYNFGNMQAGAMAVGGGDAQSQGAVSNQYDAKTIQNVRADISKIIELLHASSLAADAKAETLAAAMDAQTDPKPEKVGKLWGLLHKIGITGELVAATASLAHTAALM
jgi:hypothetical protein